MASLMDKYSNDEFEKIVLQSSSYKECLFNLGYHSNSGDSTNRLKRKIQQLNIDTSHFNSKIPIARSEENIFIEHSTADQKTLRRWYKKGEYTPYICDICGQKPFWQGKELTLILDHKNGINNDDRLENLHWVCPNCNAQLDTTNGKNINHGNYKTNNCVDCGKVIGIKSTRCVECERKHRTSTYVEGVTREELKNLIRTASFTKIGKKYGVSDNAVRKWCDKYNLPRRTSEIKTFTNEEWLKI